MAAAILRPADQFLALASKFSKQREQLALKLSRLCRFESLAASKARLIGKAERPRDAGRQPTC
jgi:hypothetical protein